MDEFTKQSRSFTEVSASTSDRKSGQGKYVALLGAAAAYSAVFVSLDMLLPDILVVNWVVVNLH